ncbi:hypothetical protein Pan14r_48840 [Crateriforma conspicua]|uniref:Uncharacterized protein n=2 Tax=Crateriforma conspicua TaxID=2527996 RepID=A0A5C5YBT4_9PLAN|nr:hypothetical protein Pan14r_48840 [Crateriforma conspicua]
MYRKDAKWQPISCDSTEVKRRSPGWLKYRLFLTCHDQVGIPQMNEKAMARHQALTTGIRNGPRCRHRLWCGPAALLVGLALPAISAVAQEVPPNPSTVSDESVRRINGYRGIWFTLGQFYGQGEDGGYIPMRRQPTFPYGDKYSGGLATYTAKHVPLAVHCPEVDKTFFVYGGAPEDKQRYLLCMVSYYDHRTGQVPRPVVVHDKGGVDDPHDNPSLLIDDQGHLWVFVSGRGRTRPGYKYRSRRPYSIDGFEQIREEELTYPQPWWIDGLDTPFVHLFTKYTGVRELYVERSVDGQTWTEDQQLAGIRRDGDRAGGHYQTSAVWRQRIGTFFNRHPGGNVDKRTDLYYLQSDDGGVTWADVEGNPVETPVVDVENPCRVRDFESDGRNVYLKNMVFDHQGRPACLIVTSGGHEPGPPNAPRRLKVVRWTGNVWVESEVTQVDHNYDMGSLIIHDDQWIVMVPSDAGPQADHGGGEIVRWSSRDSGATWQRENAVTENSVRSHNYVRHPVDAADPFFVFWADGDPTELSPSRLYFADSTGRHVHVLPDQMETDKTPVQVIDLDTSASTKNETP